MKDKVIPVYVTEKDAQAILVGMYCFCEKTCVKGGVYECYDQTTNDLTKQFRRICWQFIHEKQETK